MSGASARIPPAPGSASRAGGGAAGTAGQTGVPLASPGASDVPVPVPPSPHRGPVIPGQWPLQDTLELGPLPGAVPCARLHARQVLWEWGLARLSENTELLVTELMTNAIAASRSAAQTFPVRLWLLADRTRVLTLVWDASPRPPVPAALSHDAENGRGLLLVQAISQRWDWYLPKQAGGKIVWALLENPLRVTGRTAPPGVPRNVS
jgi:anti-sigma regulatory factor (Ser/Thr protein kinase)